MLRFFFETAKDFGFYLKKLFLDATQSPCKGALMIAIITRAYGA